jgi:hypothetical protein
MYITECILYLASTFVSNRQSCFEEKTNIWNVISVQEFVLTKYISHYIVAPNKPLAPTFLFGINVFSDHTAFISYSGDHKYKYINFIQQRMVSSESE